MEGLKKWRTCMCLLLVACFVLPGMGSVVQNARANETETDVTDHSVWVDEESAYPYLLMVWVEDGDVYFSSALINYYAETLEDIRDELETKRDMSSGGTRARYNQALGHIEQALTVEESRVCVDNLAKSVVHLETLSETETTTHITNLVAEQAWLNLLYNENKTLDTTKALEHYNQALAHLDGGRRVAAMQTFTAAFKHIPISLLTWDKTTRLSYDGTCKSPIVYWAYDEAQQVEMLHAGWTEMVDGEEHVMYARSTNLGRTWWILDATQYASPYLAVMGVTYDISDILRAKLIMQISRLLEKIWIVDGCHFFYVPIDGITPLPPGVLPGSYVIIDDPLLERYQYNRFTIGGRDFYSPICGGGGGGGGGPTPPSGAPDLIISDLVATPSPVLEGENTKIEVKVMNIGTCSISGTVSIRLENNGVLTTKSFSNVGIGIGGETILTVLDYKMENEPVLVAEVIPHMPEGDSSNNYMSKVFPFVFRNDISIENFEPAGYVVMGQPFGMHVTIKNTGHQTAYGGEVYVRAPGTNVDVTTQFSSLSPGLSTVVTVSCPGIDVNELFEFYAIATLTGEVDGNANNNQAWYKLPVYEVKNSDWIITSDLDVWNKAFLLKGNVEISYPSLATFVDCQFTFDSVTDKHFKVNAGSELHSVGNTFTAISGKRYGMLLEGTTTFTDTKIEHLTMGIEIKTPNVLFVGGEVANSANIGILSNGYPVNINGTYFHHNPEAIRLFGSNNNMIQNSTFYRNNIGIRMGSSTQNFPTSAVLRQCNFENTKNFDLTGNAQRSTILNLEDNMIDFADTTRFTIGINSAIRTYRSMFITLYKSDGQKDLTNPLLTINGQNVMDDDDGILDGRYMNLTTIQRTLTTNTIGDYVGLSLSNIPTGGYFDFGFMTHPDIALVHQRVTTAAAQMFDWDHTTTYTPQTTTLNLKWNTNNIALYDSTRIISSSILDGTTINMDNKYYDQNYNLLWNRQLLGTILGRIIDIHDTTEYPKIVTKIETTMTSQQNLEITEIYGLSTFYSPQEALLVANTQRTILEMTEQHPELENTLVNEAFALYSSDNWIVGYECPAVTPTGDIKAQMVIGGGRMGFPLMEYGPGSDLDYVSESWYGLPFESERQILSEWFVGTEVENEADEKVLLAYSNKAGGGNPFSQEQITASTSQQRYFNIPHVDNWRRGGWHRLPPNRCWAAAQTMILRHWGKIKYPEIKDVSKYYVEGDCTKNEWNRMSKVCENKISGKPWFDYDVYGNLGESGDKDFFSKYKTYSNDWKPSFIWWERPAYFGKTDHALGGEGYRYVTTGLIWKKTIPQIYFDDPNDDMNGDTTTKIVSADLKFTGNYLKA